mmetsp:Transcript_50634/g.133216  ORF Transcript_50634/g.133216 Transcript_50634/m.133216 type:complete len:402 (+) Transcript_50634:1-1206(+)
MKADCFRGVSVVVMTPFPDHVPDFRLPGREAQGWQVLSKPCGSLKLFSSFSQVLSDNPADSSGGALRIDRTVPLCSESLSHPPRTHAADGSTPFRILIVDNHPVNQKLLVWIVESSGSPERPQPICDLAHNGLHACDCVSYSEYDLVLMDMNMPVMTGREATAEIRRMEGQGELLTFLSPIPIVGMSAMTKKFTPEEYTEMGMDDFLQWPVDRSVVDGVITHYLAKSAASRPPVVDVNLVLNHCEGDASTTISMLDEFVRTSLLQLGMLRNGLITEQENKLYASTDAIRSAARRFGAPWLLRAASEFARLLPGMPAHMAPRKKKMKKPEKLHSRRLRQLQAIEKEIVRIGDAVQSIREALQPQDDSHRLLAIKEDEREERANVEHNDVSSHSSAATESQCL